MKSVILSSALTAVSAVPDTDDTIKVITLIANTLLTIIIYFINRRRK